MLKKAGAPMKNDYRTEMDVTPELDLNDSAYYKSLVGVLRYIVELRRVDIVRDVSMMLSCLVLPREGSLQALIHLLYQ